MFFANETEQTKRMKRATNLILLVLLPALAATGQTHKPFIPTGSSLDVESLNGSIDTDMDISRLSLSDLRILRNAFAARQGYCFTDYALRAVFGCTTWYDSLLFSRYDSELADKPLEYTPRETAFIERLKAREAELKRQNFSCREGERVNTANIVNGFQLEEVSVPLYRRLARDGFAIVPRQNIQLFHCYENNDYHDFPSFITTDLHLQMLHTYFSSVLTEVERHKMRRRISVFADDMYKELAAESVAAADDRTASALSYAMMWTEVCNRLAGGKPNAMKVDEEQAVAGEVARVMAAEDDLSPFLGYSDVRFMYSLFRPRGNYSRSENMKRYFRSMMWLQSAPFCTADKGQLRSLVTMADALNRNDGLRRMLASVSGALSVLVGQPDGLSLLDVAGMLKSGGYDASRLTKDDRMLALFARKLDAMSRGRMRIRPKTELSCVEKICVMPQRYLYDSEVLQELVDVDTSPATLRGYPTGLDVMAAFGSETARRILTDELKEPQRWPEYAPRLDSMKALMPLMSRDTTVYNCWMKALTDLQNVQDSRYPYFMKTPQWGKKNLNTALASWTELRHDVLLYAKQPMAAECGGGIPDPVVVGYVEPNAPYWSRALALVKRTEEVLRRCNMMTERIEKLTTEVEEQTAFLLAMAEKELQGTRLTEEEFRSIEKLGSTYEWLTLDIMKENATQSGMTWEDVQGTDKSVSVVADVYTANGINNPDKGILHEGVGLVDDIFVVVEINGYLHLTRGAVFSYREFKTPLGSRLTDEEWQRKLDESPRYGVPSWMDEIVLPDPVPADNELIFYSSGC